MALPTTPIRVTVLGTTTTTPTPTTTEMCTSTTRQAAGSSTPAAAGRSHRLASIALTRITGPRHAIRARAAGATFTPGGWGGFGGGGWADRGGGSFGGFRGGGFGGGFRRQAAVGARSTRRSKHARQG